MNKIINGSVESLTQMIEFITTLNDDVYRLTPMPIFTSSIGQHLRHVIDLYVALIGYDKGNNIDYDCRRRGIALETERNEGLTELNIIREWLLSIDINLLNLSVNVHCEVSVYKKHPVQMASSLAREICFTSIHLTHHLALMTAIAKYLGEDIDDKFGLAPTTASFLRSQNQKNNICAP